MNYTNVDLLGIEEDAAARSRRIGAIATVLSLSSAALSGYHGVKRHRGSVGWGITWFLLGGFFPIITPVIALGQGFAKPEGR